MQIETDASNNSFQAYLHRHRNLYEESGSPSPHFFSFDVASEHAAPGSIPCIVFSGYLM